MAHRSLTVLVTTFVLSACGVETAGTAAAVGVSQKQALEQGQAAADRMQEQLKASAELARERNESMEKAGR
ncbi:MAG: hypothetical protein Q8S02_15305 [Hydrogenophaga sp.]|nr:hypothetical protein [Hydrogenophaga sp.]